MLADARTMSAHVVETTCELSAFIKGGVMAASSERDAGFCSGGDEDDNMSGLHSPSASEDSVEVQVTPISLRNKRKLAEPRKIQEPNMAPLKKRRFEQIDRTSVVMSGAGTKSNIGMTVVQDEESRPAGSPSPSPFRPWSSPAANKSQGNAINCNNNNNDNSENETKESTRKVQSHREDSQDSRQDLDISRRHDENRWIEEENKRRDEEARRRYEARIQEEVLSRLHESDNRHQQKQKRPLSPISPQLLSVTSTRSSSIDSANSIGQRRETRQKQRFVPPSSTGSDLLSHPRLQDEPLSLVLRGESPRVPGHPAVSGTYDSPSSLSYGVHSLHSPSHRQNDHRTSVNDHPRHETNSGQTEAQQQQQRNYKNMTRERRIEANARERTRVHTISAAFDTLRKAIPAYSNNQKLSKLSVLRIACSYIMTLSNIANTAEGEPTTSASLGACVDLVSRTIQTEGKLRKKKDE